MAKHETYVNGVVVSSVDMPGADEVVKRGKLEITDFSMARFAEDLFDALKAKGLISEEDLPQAAREIIAKRKALRG